MEFIMITENVPTKEDLPPEPLLGLREAMKVRGCKSPVTIWNNIRQGKFPAPDAMINNVRLWRQSSLRKWQDQLTNRETSNVVIGEGG